MNILTITMFLLLTTPGSPTDVINKPVDGELVMPECAVLTMHTDGPRFHHTPECLAKIKNEHGRLLFPTIRNSYDDVIFGVFVGKQYYRLEDVPPEVAKLLLKGLKHAATHRESVYVSLNGSLHTSSDRYTPISARIVNTSAQDNTTVTVIAQ
jgi:hypothetical protein